MDDTTTFLRNLFDFDFTQFITTRAVRFIYFIFIIGSAVLALSTVASAFRASFMAGIGMLVIAPLLFLIGVILARIGLELVIAIFRIADQLRFVTERLRQDRP